MHRIPASQQLCTVPRLVALVATLVAPLVASPALAESARAGPGPGIERSALAAGRFLVAARRLRDPNFVETVVLLVDYDESGALGLIVNRPTEVRLAGMLPALEELRDREDAVFIGGPVARNRLVLLFRSPAPRERSSLVVDGVYASSDLEVLRTLAGEDVPFRAYVGYSGWAPGQLDAEVLRGDWHVAPADANSVFDPAPLQLWRTLIRRSVGQWARAPGGAASSLAPLAFAPHAGD